MSKEEFFKVPKLQADGSNWVTYKDRLQWALDARGVLNHIDTVVTELEVLIAKELSPTDDSAADDPSEGAKVQADTVSITELVARSSELRHDKWCSNEATVKQCIASSVPDSVFNRVKMKNTAKDIWDAVAQIFEGRSLMVAINLRQKMQNVSCGASNDVCAHFNKLAEMNENLFSIRVTLEDHEYASILIGSLPSIYEPTISSILASAKLGKTPLDPDTVISLITDDFDRRELTKKRTKRDERDVAFHVDGCEGGGGRRSGGSFGRGGSGGRKNVTCHNCKKKGHFKADCWAKGGGMEGKGPKGKKGEGKGGQGAVANVAEAKDDDDDGIWAVVDEEEEFDDWEIADDMESLTLTQPRCRPFRLSQSLRTRLALCLSCSLSALPNTPSKGIPHLISRLQAAVTALFTSYPATFLSQNPLCVWICSIPLFPRSQAQP